MNFWALHKATIEFSMANAMLALSFYGTLAVGVLSLGPVAAAAVAGFASADVSADTSVPFLLLALFGGLIGSLVTALIAIPLRRLTSHWAALATLALLLIVRVLVINLDGITGGLNGKTVVQSVTVIDLAVLLVAICWLFARLRHSRAGLAIDAIRHDPDVAVGLGIHTGRVVLLATLLSGFAGGVAGVGLANLLQYIDADTYYLTLGFGALAGVLLGGAHHWLGAVVGAVIFTSLPDALRNVVPTNARDVITGALLIVVVIYFPRGLIDPARARRRRARHSDRFAAPRTQSAAPTGPASPPPRGNSRSGSHEPILVVDDLVKQFGGLNAIDRLTLSIPRNSIFGIMGPNGAGKSTLVNLITGNQRATSGSISLSGVDLTGRSPSDIGLLGIARTYQNIRLIAGLSAVEQVAIGSYRYQRPKIISSLVAGPAQRRERSRIRLQARHLLNLVGLHEGLDRAADTLSYADQRRVEIARALATKPALLLLDEPTAGMNAVESRRLGELFVRLREQDITLIVVEHNMGLVLEFCTEAAVLNFGELLIQGPPRQCVEDPAVRAAYFGDRHDAQRIKPVL